MRIPVQWTDFEELYARAQFQTSLWRSYCTFLNVSVARVSVKQYDLYQSIITWCVLVLQPSAYTSLFIHALHCLHIVARDEMTKSVLHVGFTGCVCLYFFPLLEIHTNLSYVICGEIEKKSQHFSRQVLPFFPFIYFLLSTIISMAFFFSFIGKIITLERRLHLQYTWNINVFFFSHRSNVWVVDDIAIHL